MTKKLFLLLALMFLGCSLAMAAGPGTPNNPTDGGQWVAITAGFSMAIASGLCGLAQSKAIASAAEGMARNPGAATAIRGALILGLIFIESLSLYVLVIIFAKVS
ncbi:MAG TPA: ATP synthase F0 subunit C [Verrucomicrobiae bacterium]|nr:ATP synthase F0 subunit C [Verrucomicrobiae bacterium]